MPLPILLALVVGGIGGVVLLVHLLGWSAPRRFEDDADAIKAFALDFPDAEVKTIYLSDDRLRAICISQAGVGFVASMGTGLMTRMVASKDVKEISDTKNGMTLKLADFTAPRLNFPLKNAEARQDLAVQLRDALEKTT
jgi:hypothetical protein